MRTSFVSLLGLVLAAGLAHADEEWAHVKEQNGVLYERRSVAGSKFYEYRATLTVSLPPARALDLIWSELSAPPPPHVTHREFLRKTDNDIVIHDDIKTPVVSDRELTLRLERYSQPTLGMRFETRNDLGPPPNPKRVQLPIVRGGWRIEPAGAGSRLVYTCYSEPGGSVPAWMVRGAQQDQVVRDIERQLTRLRAAH
jgi:hypothetical protein